MFEENDAIIGKGFFDGQNGNLDRQEILIEKTMDDFFYGVESALGATGAVGTVGTVGVYTYIRKIINKRSINHSQTDWYQNPMGLTLRKTNSYLKETESDCRKVHQSLGEIHKAEKKASAAGIDLKQLSKTERAVYIKQQTGNKVAETIEGIEEKLDLLQSQQPPISIDSLYRKSEMERSAELNSTVSGDYSGREEVLDGNRQGWEDQASTVYIDDFAGKVADSLLEEAMWKTVNKYVQQYDNIEAIILTKYITEVARDNMAWFNQKAVAKAIGKALTEQGIEYKSYQLSSVIKRFKDQMRQEAQDENSAVYQMIREYGIRISG
jgi:hypothetical protein